MRSSRSGSATAIRETPRDRCAADLAFPVSASPLFFTMAARASLNAMNLGALGPARLVELLRQHTEGNAAARRALRLALAERGAAGDGADRFRHALTATGINQPVPGG